MPEVVNRFLTWNVNGLNSPNKRRKIFHYLKQFKNDIICLQETHIKAKDQKYLINARLGTHFVALSQEKKNGIVIYVKRDIKANLIEADEQGRFLAIELGIRGERILVMGVYAPNQYQENFYKLLNKKMIQWDYKSCILLGDWNGVIDVKKDKKLLTQISSTRARLPKSFFEMMEDMELRDIWREMHFEEKDFTFFSNRHQSFSRIDFILVTNDLFSRVKKTKICARVLSDHSPVQMELEYRNDGRRSWRLNENLFRYEENVKKCKLLMKEFFNLNLNKGTSLEVVWDASKAYMRGVLIQLNNEYRRKREKRRELEEEIKEKELILIRNPLDKGIQESIRLLREQFNMLMGDQVATNLQYAKHNTFCNANKPGRLLAYQLRKKQKSRIIERIVYKGKQVFQQDLIKKAFLEFYMNLYASGKISSEAIDRYLQKGNIGKITQEQREGLNRAITSEEILLVIKQLKERKAPGTDGLTAIYYKHLQVEMVEPLKELFVSIQLGGEVPPSWRAAFISLIPKEDQDLTQTKNYRPISLLNVDYKIFAKVLANRLMIVMQGLIHKDQTGFIEGRQMKSNVRQIINMLEYLEKNRQVSAALIFIDAEKAFDRLDWQFLFKVIEKMEFGDYFMRSIMTLYQRQTAQIVINGTLTESFVIERGTRQGCPLSPLLFILTLEILLNKIRETEVIKGVKVGQLEYKVRAFADDIVVTLSRPLQSVEGLKDILFQYGQVSGFKVNEGKTKLLIKNMSVRSVEELERRTGFEVVKKVKYLGVYITTSNKKLFVCNYEALWQKIRMDLEKWKKLQLSLLGRIAVIKMNILPKFLFLFQMIPILKKEEELKIWQRGINSFIWAGKKARIKQKIMQDVKERGGLKVPNLSLYYEAVVLSMISDWVNFTQVEILNLEGVGLGYGWHAYLLYGKKDDKIFKGHVLRDVLLRVWNKYLYTLNGKLPIWTIPGQVIDFIRVGDRQSTISYAELLWMERGVLQLKSLNQLRENWKTLTWFQYARLQTRWKQDQKKGIILEEGILMKQIRDQGKMHIKRLYNALVEMDSETELVKDCMIKWAQNFEEPVMLETWEKIWVTNVKFTQAQNLRENFYKMFYRWHLDPKKLSCMYPNVKPNCWRCECEDATYYHIWWTCKKVKAFWIKIWWIMQNIFKKKIKFSPQFFLLGIITDCTVRETKLMLNLITAARLLVAQYWKKEDTPTIEEWTLKVMNLAEMAKISAYLKDYSNERFVEEWRRWIEYIQRKYQMKNMKIAFE